RYALYLEVEFLELNELTQFRAHRLPPFFFKVQSTTSNGHSQVTRTRDALSGQRRIVCCPQAVLCVLGVLRGFSCSMARNQPQRTPRTPRTACRQHANTHYTAQARIARSSRVGYNSRATKNVSPGENARLPGNQI